MTAELLKSTMSLLPEETRQAVLQAATRSLRRAQRPRRRTMRQFAEDEIVVTGGPGKGRYSCETQPWTKLWFAEVDSGRWHRHVATGGSQSGKTLTCYVIPTLYHLFEIEEEVVCGVPKMEMARDKWEKDFLPAIMASRYRDLLPSKGKGSRGGSFESITFKNGASLKFMTGGGDDKSRAGYTSRVLVVTEVDGLDTGSELSRETDPISQMEARLLAFAHRLRVYLECTVTIPTGRIWQEYLAGSASKIALPCPHCGLFVTPEREHFIGWDVAETEVQAESTGAFFCPECATAWTPKQRIIANRSAKLVHRGQEITPEGQIVGSMPETRTFSFRWTETNNLFHNESFIGSIEWKEARKLDREAAEKKMCQFHWCIPYTGENTGIEISEEIVASRLTGLPRGVVPDDYESLVVQIDLHNRWHYWTLMATSPGNVRSIVDYGLLPTPNIELNGPEVAVRLGLENLADELDEPGRWKTAAGKPVPIDLHFVDAGYMQDIALEFVTGAGPSWKLIKGEKNEFRLPKERTTDQLPGDHWYLSLQQPHEAAGNRKWWLTLSETHYWMRMVHGGFVATAFLEDGKTRRPGSIALFGNDSTVHTTAIDRKVARSNFATQVLGWKWGETITPKKGSVMGWIPQWREDHWFDTTYGCLVAASFMEFVREASRQTRDRQDAERAAQESKRFVRRMEVRK